MRSTRDTLELWPSGAVMSTMRPCKTESLGTLGQTRAYPSLDCRAHHLRPEVVDVWPPRGQSLPRVRSQEHSKITDKSEPPEVSPSSTLFNIGLKSSILVV